MQAIRLTAWEQPAELVEIPCPEPGPGEVLVRVTAAGLCHSDLHLMHWRAGALPYALPFTLGHEVAGTVAALGAGADGLEAGAPVLVYGPWGCGR
jgi:alcohol dehydrogenase, propanol-preferring